jgi:alkylresorcinol/alkylpyrone synthase
VPYLLSSELGFPNHYYDQDGLLDALLELWGDSLYNPERLRTFFQNMKVDGRHLALAKEQYAAVRDFGARNKVFQEVSVSLLEDTVFRLFQESDFELSEVGVMLSTTVTGLAVPTLEARLMNRLPIDPATRRVPLFGLGCLAGAAGVARLSDMLSGTSDLGLLLAVELCSLTLQIKDLSIANLVATGLFGDGAAAVLMAGDTNKKAAELVDSQKGCKVVGTRSAFFPDSENVMGWEFDADGFQIVLNNQVPHYAAGVVSQAVKQFLEEHDLTPQMIDHWIAHPGGPKVMTALEDGIGVPGALDRSRASLAKVGNLSSVSVLAILDEVFRSAGPKRGDWGLMMAMGPAFCAELVLLKWEP